METIRDKLAQFNPSHPYMHRKALSVNEKGKKYAILFSEERLSAAFQIDGDIVKDGQKCDKLILFCDVDEAAWTEVFVELKGKDISHAIEQLAFTLKRELFKHQTVKTKIARIVGKNIPRSTGNSILDKAKIRFVKEHQCDLRAVAPGTCEKF